MVAAAADTEEGVVAEEEAEEAGVEVEEEEGVVDVVAIEEEGVVGVVEADGVVMTGKILSDFQCIETRFRGKGLCFPVCLFCKINILLIIVEQEAKQVSRKSGHFSLCL